MGRLVFLALVPFIAVVLLSTRVLNLDFIQSQKCANSISCIKDLTGEFKENAGNAIFLGRVIKSPQFLARVEERAVLGEKASPNLNKRIKVDLSKQTLYAYEDGKLVMSFPVSTGKWSPTPTGDFKIWVKLKYTRMTGGEGADYYDLPNVPYVMFFSNAEIPASRGFSLHGAYWHNNFGHIMSHGCVNISPANAEKLYNWANPVTEGNTTNATTENPGTLVTIYGEPPLD